MTLYEELQARGLVAQITDNEIIDLINNGKATFYIGFDCTTRRRASPLEAARPDLTIRVRAIKWPAVRLSAVQSKPI